MTTLYAHLTDDGRITALVGEECRHELHVEVTFPEGFDFSVLPDYKFIDGELVYEKSNWDEIANLKGIIANKETEMEDLKELVMAYVAGDVSESDFEPIKAAYRSLRADKRSAERELIAVTEIPPWKQHEQVFPLDRRKHEDGAVYECKTGHICMHGIKSSQEQSYWIVPPAGGREPDEYDVWKPPYKKGEKYRENEILYESVWAGNGQKPSEAPEGWKEVK